MSNRSDIHEGWRLFRPYVRDVVTRRRLALLLAAAPLLSVAVSVLVRLALGPDNGFVRPTLAALAAGVFAGCVLSWILLIVWRPRPTSDTHFTGRRPRPVAVPPEVQREIRVAYAEGREPRATVAQRLAAAEGARQVRRIWPRSVLGSIGAMTIVVPYALFVIAAWPRIGAFAGAFSVLIAVWAAPTGLLALGRTTALLQRIPEVPDHLFEDGRARPQPRKTLGTDHPDDYT